MRVCIVPGSRTAGSRPGATYQVLLMLRKTHFNAAAGPVFPCLLLHSDQAGDVIRQVEIVHILVICCCCFKHFLREMW